MQANRERKSVGAEDTFAVDIFELDSARAELVPLAEKVWRYCEAREITGRTVTLKVKYADFQQITRRRTLPNAIDGTAALIEIAEGLLDTLFPAAKRIRLLGVTLSSLESSDDVAQAGQLALF